EEWISDKDRFAFLYARQDDRLTRPLVRDESGQQRAASWSEAFEIAARGLRAAGPAGVLTGGRLTAEDAYAYAKFARVALGTNDIDFRARAHSVEEAEFLAAHVVLRRDVTYADLETARCVVLLGLEPEDEAPTIFLRLRKASHASKTPIWSVAPFTSRGLHKMGGRLIPTVPGEEAAAIAAIADNRGVALDSGGVVLVGERLAHAPGALTAAADLARTTGARLAWVPRRAGDRGAVEVGALPNLLPGGRPAADAAARVDLAAAWGVDSLPEAVGRDGNAIIAAAATGELSALVVAGVDVGDLADPSLARAALSRADFVVSLELRRSEVTELADVVFPVAPMDDKSGTFVNWEGRLRSFDTVLGNPHALPDVRVLAGISEELGAPLGIRTPEQAYAEMTEVGPWDGASTRSEQPARPEQPTRPRGGYVLASWKQLLDDGRMQDGDRYLRQTARRPVVLVNARTLAELGVAEGDDVRLSGELGSLVLPVGVADLVDGVVWAPASAPDANVRHLVGPAGSRVELQGGGR
ncbi:MAG: molybdopterin-dependent oxidoreductase, partial [Actinomycetota bacterium]|nr:molybdopterin-dependent oxidoreductase [Actinomycetota bacterium]